VSRATHILAASILIIVALANFLWPRALAPKGDPKAQLIALMQHSGYVYEGSRPVLHEAILSFKRNGCDAATQILYLPALNRIPNAAFAQLRPAAAKILYVHDGDIVESLSAWRLIPRWTWRKLRAALRLGPSEPWQSIALAVAVPPGCLAKGVHWARLARP
jgi:hypothetical protein